ncbi:MULTISPECIES: hypothetical protein [unclassified Aurantimonas]|uniref:hypothetical protein n=1 Tax=unclassified Aurantimonas TaxID=2638230 RepID=UPI002E185B13|nr:MULTISPECIES: hypothetical protein [unclassified Aurantimonas]MEC5291929.1 hypothetical protein [Aurantimonas sp. C2-3-R2]MEC5413015.1 hypothetical protein [Aurantimonas sp. C2-4-R8]
MRAISLNIITAAALLSSTALVLAQDSGGTGGFPGFGTPREARDDAPKPSNAPSSDLPIQTVDDSPAMAGFPEGTVLDILGLEPGMTAEEIKAAYTGFDPMTGPSDSEVFAANSENGSEVSFEYPGEMTAFYPADHHGGERPGVTPGSQLVTVRLGSEAIGGRAIKIIREFVPAPDEKITIEAYKNNILGKYGEPSAVDNHRNIFVWSFNNGEKNSLVSWPAFVNQERTSATYGLNDLHQMEIPGCYFALKEYLSDEGLYPQYQHKDERPNRSLDCNGGLYIELQGQEFVQRATFISVDHQRALQNAAELDQVISERLKTDTGPVNAPQL